MWRRTGGLLAKCRAHEVRMELAQVVSEERKAWSAVTADQACPNRSRSLYEE